MSTLISIGTGACNTTMYHLQDNLNAEVEYVFIDPLNGREYDESIIDKLEKTGEKVVLFATLGGNTGSSFATRISSDLKSRGIKFRAILTLPFVYEGRVMITRALSAHQAISENASSLSVFNMEKYRMEYGHLPTREFFQVVDTQILNTISLYFY